MVEGNWYWERKTYKRRLRKERSPKNLIDTKNCTRGLTLALWSGKSGAVWCEKYLKERVREITRDWSETTWKPRKRNFLALCTKEIPCNSTKVICAVPANITSGDVPLPCVQALAILLLMTVLTKALFALVCCNFVTFTFFSARHTATLNVCKNYQIV